MANLNKTDKHELVEKLHEELNSSSAVFLTDHCGLNVADLTKLRKNVHANEGSYRVVKNTLLKLAAKDTAVEGIADHMVGPTAIAVAQGDPLGVAKALVEFAKANNVLELQAGVLGESILSVDDIKQLADMPSKEVLLAQMLGSISAPTTNFVGTLAAVIRQLVYVLKAVEEQKNQA